MRLSGNLIIAGLIVVIAAAGWWGALALSDLIQNGEGRVSRNRSEGLRVDFDAPLTAEDGKAFGPNGFLTFELYRGGTFDIDGTSGTAIQRSVHYGDVSLIRSTDPLPDTYTIRIEAGEIDYDVNRVQKYDKDPAYAEGPRDENGCYLIAITDTLPDGHYTNDWWHRHRKLVIDVDNNVWGHGMPNPVFMVFFNEKNELRAFDGRFDQWGPDWEKAVEYEAGRWYVIELEKNTKDYVFRIFDEGNTLLKEARVERSRVWREGAGEYFVIGDPHENYYEGTMRIRSIEIK